MFEHLPHTSYYDRRNRPMGALLRARQPFLVRNALSLAGLAGCTLAIYSYTIRAVSQDDFEDVIVPDAPSKPVQQPPPSKQPQP
ncbi:hypothetical protein BDY21DRAFT_375395 [Lineolata rhizophorae]|uniref:Cytochrome c oxidase assembly factor 3 n=1 Tax=Lineolata rhizophorae TaxID=578093 RepID=A0A6A6NN74_9PEZI|nr:hypothetical protein BDY21DRAFT_375395 [Lineolata rhizophorae]